MNQGECSSRTECRWDVDECVLSRQRINTDDHWINFIGAPWSLDTMDADLVDTTCRDLVEETECSAVSECGWDEAELLCYIEEGADEHMYVATLGVGIQHVTRTVKESEPLSAHQLILAARAAEPLQPSRARSWPAMATTSMSSIRT